MTPENGVERQTRKILGALGVNNLGLGPDQLSEIAKKIEEIQEIAQRDEKTDPYYELAKNVWTIVQDLPSTTSLLDLQWREGYESEFPAWNELCSSLTDRQMNFLTLTINALIRYNCSTLADIPKVNFNSREQKRTYGHGVGPKGRMLIERGFLGEGFDE